MDANLEAAAYGQITYDQYRAATNQPNLTDDAIDAAIEDHADTARGASMYNTPADDDACTCWATSAQACPQHRVEPEPAYLAETLMRQARLKGAACPNHPREAAGRCPFCDCGAPSRN